MGKINKDMEGIKHISLLSQIPILIYNKNIILKNENM